MIKRVTKFLNNRIVLQKQYRLASKKQGDDTVPDIDLELVEDVKQQLQQAAESGENLQLQATQAAVQEVAEEAVTEYDQFEGVNLIDSNWKQLAPLVHTAFTFNKKDPQFHKELEEKLSKIQSVYRFDLRNLDRLKLFQQRQFDIRSSINAVSNDPSRYLEVDIAQNSRIGYGTMTIKRFKQMIESKNLPAIIQTYRNNEYKYFTMQSDFIVKILESVVSSNFQTQYLLNLLEYYKIAQKDTQKQLKSNKNLQKILQNLNNLNDVNKLKFLWSLNTTFENGIELINFTTFSSELTKIGFQGLESQQTEKTLKFIYSSTLGKDALKKLINYSLNRYSTNFDDFLLFWGLFNILITKLYSLNQTSLANPSNLNHIFQLFELNSSQPKQIISQIIPEALFETKNKSLFQIYRQHAKFWIEKKPQSKTILSKDSFDEFIQHKMQFQDPIRIIYNGWKSENAAVTQNIIRTTKNVQNNKNIQRKDELLSEIKMIEHLINGDYSFVLNHILLVFNPGLDKNSFISLKNIIRNAKDLEFDNENSRALYILKNINEEFKYLAEPVTFRRQFLTNYKKVKWMERSDQQKQQRLAKRQAEQNKFSRKESQRFDGDEPFQLVNSRQKIRSKPKRHPEGALFSKKNKNLFSTQKDSYNEYRQVVKEVTQTSVDFGFNFGSANPDINAFKTEVERRSKQMNQNNHKALLRQTNLPIVGNGTNLLKYLFLKKPDQTVRLDEKLKKKLQVNFISEIGALQKDYSEYLSNNRFNFPLVEQVYISLLQDQKVNYVRRTFKTIVTHMIAYRASLSYNQVELICQICSKNRIGITLIQIFNLIIENKIIMPKESVYTFCDTLQKFKKINNDIFLMSKKYCENVNMDFQIKIMSSYVKNLLVEEQDERLSDLCQIIKTQLKPKPYKVKNNISAEQNIKQQKEYKQFQKKQYNRILFEIIDMVVLNVNNKLPVFISNLFDEYEKTKLKLDANEIAISLIVYCNNVDKFLEIIRTLKSNKENIVPMTFDCAIKAARLNPRGLESHSEEIFNAALFTHNFILTEQQIQKTVQIFKILNSPTVFIKFLEYILRFNPPVNYENKNSMYFIMNNINDDFAKNTISGLLDFIFNQNRQKQRQEYRKAQIIEEQKVKLLQDIEKKDFFVDNLQIQQEKVIQPTTEIKENKKAKKNKNQDNQKQKIQKQITATQKTQNQPASSGKTAPAQPVKTKVPKVERKRISMKTDEQFLHEDNNPVLKKSALKKKLRTKSLDNFEELYTKREQIEQVPLKGGKAANNKEKPAQKGEKKVQKKK